MQVILLPEPSATNQALELNFVFIVIPKMGFKKSLGRELLSAEQTRMAQQLVCQVINNLLLSSFIQFRQVDTHEESRTQSAFLNNASLLK